MDGYIVHGGLNMARGSFARIVDGKGILLYVWDGELWITQESDRRDYFIQRGEWFQVERGGVALAYARRRASISLTAPVPAHYARRITLTLPGTSAPRVIYDRAQEPGGWLDGARHRLARFWSDSYAPFSRPTTAAL
jgi:hypothetical protein